jgi:hypothetical protein
MTQQMSRSPGRPRTRDGDYDPVRSTRVGPLWDECVRQAEADGEKMTAFVIEAIARELARRRRKAARAEQAAPAHPLREGR